MSNQELLNQAKGAGARLALAERDALLARADYHTAIRRLHLAGTSLRDIAQALSLSHQRVQQIVTAAGGSWWQVWRRRRMPPDAVCSWCERPPSEVDKLIAGPKVFICDSCVASVERRLASGSRVSRHRCAFCGKRGDRRRQVVAGPPHICSECTRVCREILDSRAA